MKNQNLTPGNILTALLKFAIPVFFALFLQAMYGAVDLVIVGKFAEVADQSGVASGSMLMSIPTTVVAGLSMGITVFIGEASLAAIFSNDAEVIAAAHSYLKAYAIDCLLTAVFFCFVGYFNGCEKSFFVMMQGLIGAFCVRIPVVYLMSRIPNASLFMIGLGTPASSLVQTILCIGAFFYYEKKWKKN